MKSKYPHLKANDEHIEGAKSDKMTATEFTAIMSDDDFLARGDKTRAHRVVAMTKWRQENGKRVINVDLDAIDKRHTQWVARNRIANMDHQDCELENCW